MVERPTTLNSMTHYALTEDQEGVMEEGAEGEEAGEALRHALQSTPSNPYDTRIASAMQSGLLLPEADLRRLLGGVEPERGEDAPQEGEQQQEEEYSEEDNTNG